MAKVRAPGRAAPGTPDGTEDRRGTGRAQTHPDLPSSGRSFAQRSRVTRTVGSMRRCHSKSLRLRSSSGVGLNGVMLPDILPTLVHEPILLRAFHDTDMALVQSVSTDPLIPLITSVPASGTPDDSLAYIKRQHERLLTGKGFSFAIALASTDEAVGQIGLWLDNIHQGRVSTGYWIAPQFRWRGYAKAALRAVTEWALELDEVHRVELYVESWNERSWSTAEACGFEREGLLRSWQQVGSERKDMYMYSRIAPR